MCNWRIAVEEVVTKLLLRCIVHRPSSENTTLISTNGQLISSVSQKAAGNVNTIKTGYCSQLNEKHL